MLAGLGQGTGMIHLLRSLALTVAAVLLGAANCTPPPPPSSPPATPMLMSGRVTGNQICGAATISQGPLGTFTCTMPTAQPTAFLLTPAMRNTPNGAVPNETAVLTVTTQTARNLDIELRSGAPGNLLPQRQFPASSGLVPQPLGNYGEVAVSMADDGTTRTWTLTMRLSPCRQVAILEIAAVAPGGPPSPALDVVLFRNDGEVQSGCAPETSRATLLSINPTHGAPGRMVTLTGSGFSSTAVQVKFGNRPPIPATLDNTLTTTTVAVPQAPFGTVNVSIVDPTYLGTNAVGFTITGATPAISSIVPQHDSPFGTIALNGQHFGPGMVVRLQSLSTGATTAVTQTHVPLAGTFASFPVPNILPDDVLVTIGYTDETFSNAVNFHIDPRPTP
jgi:hypothetical protein